MSNVFVEHSSHIQNTTPQRWLYQGTHNIPKNVGSLMEKPTDVVSLHMRPTDPVKRKEEDFLTRPPLQLVDKMTKQVDQFYKPFSVQSTLQCQDQAKENLWKFQSKSHPFSRAALDLFSSNFDSFQSDKEISERIRKPQ